jgi:hypothetical protein
MWRRVELSSCVVLRTVLLRWFVDDDHSDFARPIDCCAVSDNVYGVM